ncbi:uncharacterized protein LOC119445649 [Dermacentor silvarum]|uniref:uncharacterized protein LOC119445649 n=1 Tax=Dermacentor silvarum TaxID=543639 RepID=UPI00189B653D|nr:uncharacterized protein LOC119445649 [Dermacentor silvarum]
MRKRPVQLLVLGFAVVLQLLDAAAGESCPKKIWRQLGLTGYLSSCRYWCRGLLPRIGYEKDGTPCTRFFRSGACRNGYCITDVPPDPSLQTQGDGAGGRNGGGVVQSTGSGSAVAVPPSKAQGAATTGSTAVTNDAVAGGVVTTAAQSPDQRVPAPVPNT